MIDPAMQHTHRPEALSIMQALRSAAPSGVDRLDAQLMLANLFQQPRAWLIANGDAVLSDAQRDRYANWLSRRRAGEPLAYLTGEKEFHGLRLQVGPQVLVPRPDTETLVDWGLELLTGALSAVDAPHIVDLGTGSGAIALAVKHRCAPATVTAVDVSEPALEIARRNAQALGLPVAFVQGRWWSAVSAQRFHLALANPPYIAPDDEHLAALHHEPQSALVSIDNGLADLHQIIDGAPGCLVPGGWLLLEHGHDQAAAVRQRLTHAGFQDVQTRLDLGGHERCTGGQLGRCAAHP